MFNAKILADSQHPHGISRLTTMELTYPRCVHTEFMTHRQFSRNAASSRAIPIEKMLERIMEDPFIPVEWGTNQAGMVAAAQHTNPEECVRVWLDARDIAVQNARRLNYLNLHKQIVNRITEPWMWITVIATGVDHAWENFFSLRCATDAEPHIRRIAYMARGFFDRNVPNQLDVDGYHLPLIGFPGDEALDMDDKVKVCVGRCARVSYLTHAGTRDVIADIKMYDRLKENKHASPFEHAARPRCDVERMLEWPQLSNFGPHWHQHRKELEGEYCMKAPR